MPGPVQAEKELLKSLVRRTCGDPQLSVIYAGHNVVATLALVVALGGGTAWATNYIIVSSATDYSKS